MKMIGIGIIILLMLTTNGIAIENVTEDVTEIGTNETDTNVTEIPLTPEDTIPVKTPILERPFETTVPPKPTEAPGFEGITGVIGLISMVILKNKLKREKK